MHIYMTENILEKLTEAFVEHQQAEREEWEARTRLYATIREAMQVGPRGTQVEITRITGLTRERIRTITRPYHRTITRFTDDGLALITLPESTGIHPDAEYEIRVKTEGNVEVLGIVQGQELIDAREEQLSRYLTEDPSRTNIRMVDVSHLVDVSDYI